MVLRNKGQRWYFPRQTTGKVHMRLSRRMWQMTMWQCQTGLPKWWPSATHGITNHYYLAEIMTTTYYQLIYIFVQRLPHCHFCPLITLSGTVCGSMSHVQTNIKSKTLSYCWNLQINNTLYSKTQLRLFLVALNSTADRQKGQRDLPWFAVRTTHRYEMAVINARWQMFLATW